MQKLIIAAALSAALFSVGAAHAAQPAVKVSLVGKSSQQIESEIRIAARSVCEGLAPGSLLAPQLERACVKRAVQAALALAPATHHTLPTATRLAARLARDWKRKRPATLSRAVDLIECEIG